MGERESTFGIDLERVDRFVKSGIGTDRRAPQLRSLVRLVGIVTEKRMRNLRFKDLSSVSREKKLVLFVLTL